MTAAELRHVPAALLNLQHYFTLLELTMRELLIDIFYSQTLFAPMNHKIEGKVYPLVGVISPCRQGTWDKVHKDFDLAPDIEILNKYGDDLNPDLLEPVTKDVPQLQVTCRRASVSYLNLIESVRGHELHEQWRYCPGLSRKYQVSNFGRVRVKVRGSDRKLELTEVRVWKLAAQDLDSAADQLSAEIKSRYIAAADRSGNRKILDGWLKGKESSGKWITLQLRDRKWKLLSPTLAAGHIYYRVTWDTAAIGVVPGIGSVPGLSVGGLDMHRVAKHNYGSKSRKILKEERADFLCRLTFFGCEQTQEKERCLAAKEPLTNVLLLHQYGKSANCRLDSIWYTYEPDEISYSAEAIKSERQGTVYRYSRGQYVSVRAYPQSRIDEVLDDYHKQKYLDGFSKKKFCKSWEIARCTLNNWIARRESNSEAEKESERGNRLAAGDIKVRARTKLIRELNEQGMYEDEIRKMLVDKGLVAAGDLGLDEMIKDVICRGVKGCGKDAC